ncbi:MAG: hypothetical protein M3179_05430 [Actinomycetota bacterium]|nr:hypothetical protein [Actinomycetota bacterium]
MADHSNAGPLIADQELEVRHREVGEATNGLGEAATEKTAAADKQVPEVVKAACRFSAARGRPAAVYLLGEGSAAQGTPDTPITKRTVIQLAASLDDNFAFDDLDVVIQSSGGDIHAAYQMMSLLRGRMSGAGELVACVPRKAQSSATLLCLGCDRIALDELGALGPLDAQIRVGLTDVGTPDYSSALHLLKGLSRLQEFSLDTLNQAAALLYDKRVRRNDDILKYGIEFSRGITAPLFERIESHKIGYWDQMLKTGESYGRRLLRRGKLLDEAPDQDRELQIERVIRQLVNDYPSHEYVIDVKELSELSLKADHLRGPARSAAREFARSSSETLIMVVYPPGSRRPESMDQAAETTVREWNGFGGDTAHDVAWTDDHADRFVMRVGLYGRPITSSRNPWRHPVTTGDGPATQYFAGDDDPW